MLRDAPVWALFAVVHAWLTYLALGPIPGAYRDLDLYRGWVEAGLADGRWPVLDGAWVYPVGALLPMLVPALVSPTSTAAYTAAWCGLVTALDAAAVLMLLARRRPGRRAATWWLLFVLATGPVSMGRLDGLVAPLTLAALLLALRHPRVSAVLVTASAWVKVAPGTVLVPLALAARRPWRDVVAPAVVVCGAVLATTTALGAGGTVMSFVGAQSGRGLQLEAVGATPWLAAGLLTPTVTREFDEEIITYEIHGPGTAVMAQVLGALLPLALLACAVLLWWRRRREGPAFWSDDAARSELVVRGALLIALALVVTNKVGSPQFVTWFGPPVAAALALGLPRWRRTALALLPVALATQWVYPGAYQQVVEGGVATTLVLAARNAALVALLVVTVRHIAGERLTAPAAVAGTSGTVSGEPGEEVRT